MTGAAFVEKLKSQLETRFAANATFRDVNVHLYQVDVRPPAVVLIRERVRSEIDYTAMGRQRTEEVTIPALIGASGGSLQDAADRVEAILKELSAELRDSSPTVGVQAYNAKVASVGWIPLPNDKGGITVDCEVDITYSAQID